MYANGRGVERDDFVAVKFFKQAAEKGDPFGSYHLCTPFSNVNVNVNVKANQFHLLVRLDSMYMNGRGVEQDEVEAIRWLKRAVELGDSTAQRVLGILL